MNKELCIKFGKLNNSILWCTVEKTSNYCDTSIWNTVLYTAQLYYEIDLGD